MKTRVLQYCESKTTNTLDAMTHLFPESKGIPITYGQSKTTFLARKFLTHLISHCTYLNCLTK